MGLRSRGFGLLLLAIWAFVEASTALGSRDHADSEVIGDNNEVLVETPEIRAHNEIVSIKCENAGAAQPQDSRGLSVSQPRIEQSGARSLAYWSVTGDRRNIAAYQVDVRSTNDREWRESGSLVQEEPSQERQFPAVSPCQQRMIERQQLPPTPPGARLHCGRIDNLKPEQSYDFQLASIDSWGENSTAHNPTERLTLDQLVPYTQYQQLDSVTQYNVTVQGLSDSNRLWFISSVFSTTDFVGREKREEMKKGCGRVLVGNDGALEYAIMAAFADG
ncbi:unnamed protein product [Caenorhabditis auriculariae]|uniref:Fibronectin type-III domain-containing protein n=1 Tax=Caenorhabditis auriculariae TaxID=2777116 RepID=A0A8S1H3P7_9PELO|nr:unnamed protein product [Caenorhabditis auriculariae]